MISFFFFTNRSNLLIHRYSMFAQLVRTRSNFSKNYAVFIVVLFEKLKKRKEKKRKKKVLFPGTSPSSTQFLFFSSSLTFKKKKKKEKRTSERENLMLSSRLVRPIRVGVSPSLPCDSRQRFLSHFFFFFMIIFLSFFSSVNQIYTEWDTAEWVAD